MFDGDRAFFEKACVDYQVDATNRLAAKAIGVGISVRMYEFYMPFAGLVERNDDEVLPDFMTIRYTALPLIKAHEKGLIPEPSFDFAKLHTLPAEVFILAGRWDHTSDYRSQASLAARYPQGILFLADDNHMMSEIFDAGLYPKLVQAFLLHGSNSRAMHEVYQDLEDLRWNEWQGRKRL